MTIELKRNILLNWIKEMDDEGINELFSEYIEDGLVVDDNNNIIQPS